MKVAVYENHDTQSYEIALRIVEQIKAKKNSVLCLAGGDSPLKVFEQLVRFHQQQKIDFSQCFFVSLDEWGNLDKTVKGSCAEILYTNLFTPLNIKEEQIFFFNGKSPDLTEECTRIQSFLDQKGGLDLILLGLGMNGHLGFNEPGCDVNKKVYVTPLSTTTKEVGQKYFSSALKLDNGITLGIKTIVEARSIIIMANGSRKAHIVEQTLFAPSSNAIPSTLLQDYDKVSFLLDKEAAQNIEENI